MKYAWKQRLITVRAFTRNLGYFAGSRWHSASGPVPGNEFHVSAFFFGICVASSPDEACDDFIVTRLKELGVLCVRVDITTSREPFTERFLKRLFDEQFRVCMHLVQSREDVKAMTANPEVRAGWRSFVADILDAYGSQADIIEVGSTCNRKKWSGYTLPSFLLSWRIAWEEAHKRNIGLAGPNVTDFEPVYNIAILGEMKHCGILPVTHTDNLFVERATEPEAFDHKILGRLMAGIVRFNLIRKAQLLNDIALWAGVSTTISSQASWSLRRIARLLDDVEEKQADYVTRYCCLAAASGAMNRVFWGPLIGQREGLIDDGTSEFPEIPHVTFYGRTNGQVSNFRIRTAFCAFQTVNRFIAGTIFKRKYPSEHGLEMLEFISPDQLMHVVWTMNGLRADVSDCYESNTLEKARIYSRNGVQLERIPHFFSESPVYLVWPAGTKIQVRKTPAIIRGIRFANKSSMRFALIDHSPWKGVALAEHAGKPIDITGLVESVSREAYLVSRKTLHDLHILRDSRNRVWTLPAPWDINQPIIVKQFKPRHFVRRILQYGKPDKAQRSWNSAQELIRRGISTATPIAFFHIPERGSACENYFICQSFTHSWSVRDAFTAFSMGKTDFNGITASDLYNAIACFLRKMHERGVFFRDLSAGNLLFRPVPDADKNCSRPTMLEHSGNAPTEWRGYTTHIEFALIDTDRTKFYQGSLGIRQRLCDLMRICHPLDWQGRDTFVGKYMSLIGRPFSPYMKTPFIYYDWKHRIKNVFK